MFLLFLPKFLLFGVKKSETRNKMKEQKDWIKNCPKIVFSKTFHRLSLN